jgi:hypothetical protein
MYPDQAPSLIRLFNVVVPRTVLPGRFYRSRSCHQTGETAKTPYHGRTKFAADCFVLVGFVACLPPSSFGSRFGSRNSKTSSSVRRCWCILMATLSPNSLPQTCVRQGPLDGFKTGCATSRK